MYTVCSTTQSLKLRNRISIAAGPELPGLRTADEYQLKLSPNDTVSMLTESVVSATSSAKVSVVRVLPSIDMFVLPEGLE